MGTKIIPIFAFIFYAFYRKCIEIYFGFQITMSLNDGAGTPDFNGIFFVYAK